MKPYGACSGDQSNSWEGSQRLMSVATPGRWRITRHAFIAINPIKRLYLINYGVAFMSSPSFSPGSLIISLPGANVIAPYRVHPNASNRRSDSMRLEIEMLLLRCLMDEIVGETSMLQLQRCSRIIHQHSDSS